MSHAPPVPSILPVPRDDDDDDVAWALQTAAVQWQRGAPADAVVWLRRAVDAAIECGAAERATELNRAALRLSEHLLAQQEAPSEEPPAEASHGVDELLDAVPTLDESEPEPAGEVPVVVDVTESEQAPSYQAPSYQAPSYRAPSYPAPSYPTQSEPTESSPRPPEEPVEYVAYDGAEPLEDEVRLSDTDLEVIEGEEAEVAEAEPSEPSPSAYAEGEDRAPTGRPPPPESVPDAVPAEPVIGPVSLTEVRGFEDLPPDAQLELVRLAKIQELDSDEELNGFGVALVVNGWVSIMPTIADTACARASEGEVVFTRGSLADGVALRVVAGEDGTRVATWDADLIEGKLVDCPWVIDELRAVADRLQALAGICMGKMGERLDDSLRGMVTDRCEVRQLLPDEVLIEQGQRVGGMHIVGAGRLHLFDENGELGEELGPGDFLFADQVLGGTPAPATVRAGGGGALVLVADRMAAHELLVSVPPLLEILAS